MSIFKKADKPEEKTYIPMPQSNSKRINKSQTVFDSSSIIKANLTAQEDLTVTGNLTGTLKVNGHLYILEQAKVKGEIEADEITIKGSVEGKIKANNKVELLSTAKVKADIETHIISIQTGAILNGRCDCKSGQIHKPPAKTKVKVVDANEESTSTLNL